jgi:hypothetical protein
VRAIALNEDRLADVDELFRPTRYLLSTSRRCEAALQANSGLALAMAGKLDDALVQAAAALVLAEQMKVPVISAGETRSV